MRKRIHINSLLFQIVSTVVIGAISLAILLSIVNITISKNVFVDNFAESQMKIFHQIDGSFYEFYRDMADIMASVSNSENMKTYLMEEQTNQVEEMSNRYRLNEQMKRTKVLDYNQISVFVLSKDKKSYMFSNSDIYCITKEEIWQSEVAETARDNPGKMICKYEKSGFTNVMKNSPVVIIARSWSYDMKEGADAITFITLKEDDIKKMYSHFTSRTSDIVLLNQDNQVISSNNQAYLSEESPILDELTTVVGKMAESGMHKQEVKKNGRFETFLMQKLQSTNYKVVGIINPDAAFQEHYKTMNLVLLTLLITTAIVGLLIYFVRQQGKPLGVLVTAMKNSKENEFKEHVPIKGTDEIREVSQTYNRMVDELEHHIQQLIQVEASKRTAEIHALQMQINPHYMYNTLAGIKWLIWQGNTEKSTQVIDAFILLIRNVISNSDEFITVEQEIDNLKNYVLISQARYGDAVQVELFVSHTCNQYKVPKMILQPFVENAFFHAFPEEREGKIQVFVKESGESLRFEIQDNGIGIKTEQLLELNIDKQKEHFTGIGIRNVDDRIKLIYGLDYGINITSEEGKGTTITLFVPKRK